DLKAANEGGTLFGSLAQGYGAPPAVANAYKDVVSKFVHGQIKTSDEAVTQLVNAIEDAK
ncbi:MAG: sugar ABC transporter substrate-binding protein, partial [Mesorhizobium sp.]